MWALFAFEVLTCIKVNFNKTKMIPINLVNLEASRLAGIIDSKFFIFPLQYLGVSLSDSKLKLYDWQTIIDKVQSKV
jgi:hypothetical protein